ncbi:MAG: hypothetical protein UZ14_CFX002002743 [Chloroflexi bacterium OLB14]|nr:MAG: hypothetical protein UZ14_CFX002002743 [Chloroflexi bacterium OLB14]
MSSKIQIGDHVKIHLGSKHGDKAGWYEGKVIKIDPYSKHRSFYWVELDESAQTILNIKQISVFNPKNIEKIEE